MATNEEKTRQRDRLRHRCPSCENQVSVDDDTCPACGTERPSRGWVRVTELVVHGNLDDSVEPMPAIQGTPPVLTTPPPRPPVHRTVYLEAPGGPGSSADPEGRHTVGLAATFLSTFSLTFILVLFVYFATRSTPAPPVAGPAVAEAAPAAEPYVDAFATSEVPLPAPAVATPGPTPRPVAPPPTDVPPGAPADGEATLEPVETTSEAPAPAPATVAPAPPKPLAPRMMRFNGTYRGTIDGDPVTFTFRFLQDGVVEADIVQSNGIRSLAVGKYRPIGLAARLELEDAPDSAAATTSAYTGEITERGLKGQVTLSTGAVRYFMAQR